MIQRDLQLRSDKQIVAARVKQVLVHPQGSGRWFNT
jgi:hypothetical protein